MSIDQSLVAPASSLGPSQGGWAAVERLAGRQHGVIALWQVVGLGLPPHTFADQRSKHGWEALGRGVWAAPWSVDSFQRRCCAERVRGARARLITGASALTLWSARGTPPSQIDLWVGPALSPSARPEVRHHRGVWVSGDAVARVEGIPCVPVLRALRDAARTSSVERLKKDIAALDRMRLTTPAQVAADIDRIGRFPGKPKLRAAVHASLDGLVHSGDEALARQLLSSQPFVLHPRPLLVERGRRRVGEIDLAVCSIRYGAEIDGPHHLADGVAERDRTRDGLLDRLGWMIQRFPVQLVREHPTAFIEAVRVGAAAAAARGIDPWPCRICRIC